MILNIHPPRKALNQAFRKLKANRNEIELFKKTLIHLIDSIKEPESEEFHKNLVSDFLKTTYYGTTYYINTKGRNDLVIHNSSTSTDTVGVIVEAKKPTNKAEMLKTDNINTKAFQELVLYYLRERITLKNLEVKHLIATNIHEWYIFDANVFEKEFAENKNLVKQFIEFEEGRLSGKTTDFFYKQIAEPAIEAIKHEITFTYFDIRDYDKPLRNNDKKDDNLLISLYKLLSPAHLLKLPFANDSNSLDKVFYTELLHIIGLAETKEGGKKLIQRKKEGERNIGSLLENTIVQLDSHDKISRIQKPSRYGATYQEQLFNVALELVITWMNRILFLKLLEAQLFSYHKGNRDYVFLDSTKIRDFDDLDKLFFRVLAKRPVDRDDSINKLFGLVPYLNSSLFEPTELEHNALFISGLEDFVQLPYIASTVIKDSLGKRGTQPLSTLEYLFAFLNAYDFASEGGEEIQEDNKQLINASVLGLIFEKINGYKDGSFFTPGFITMYMCRETIRRSVVQKFNETKNWNCTNFTELYDKIEDRAEANNIINNLKICDPAVGSGHFLVSALNEIIAIKSDLKILTDRSGRRLKEYHLEVQNDELIVTDDEGDIFEYNPQNCESQRIQETLFHEKQTIIENTLFGVDINPNSVKICRLRLWIELLKNAYYKAPDFAELETLPNIDINIKCGNSLISRYALDADIKTALKRSKWSIDSYRLAVMNYRNATSKEEKRELERLIELIKTDFETEIAITDKRFVKLQKAKGELMVLTTQTSLFERSKAEQTIWNKQVNTLAEIIKSLETEIEEIKNNKIYENAFEWRFEFPEVLNDEGDFVGFDIVIGNPPYFSLSAEPSLAQIAKNYKTYSNTGDIYSLFIELSQNILAKNAISTLIISNKWMRTNYGQILRNYIVNHTNPIELIDFGQNLLFDNAVVHTNILSLLKQQNSNALRGVRFPDGFFTKKDGFIQYINSNSIFPLAVDDNVWNIVDAKKEKIKAKAEEIGKKIKEWNINFRRGLLTGLNEAFIIDNTVKNNILTNNITDSKFIKPILRGRDTRRFFCEFKDLWLINIPKGYTIKTETGDNNIVLEPIRSYGSMEDNEAWMSFKTLHSGVAEHLLHFKSKAIKREDKGDFWWELRACTYIAEFEKPKIIFSEIVSEPQFYFDEKGFYPEATVFFISGEKLKYLTALLNSKCVTFLFKTFYMGGELVGKIRYKKAFLEQIPIPYPTNEQELQFINIVDAIILQKQQDPKSDTTALEAEIDRLVYELYGLTEAEIEIVEKA